MEVGTLVHVTEKSVEFAILEGSVGEIVAKSNNDVFSVAFRFGDDDETYLFTADEIEAV